MMTLAEFNELSLPEKAERIWSWGFLIAKRQNQAATAVLFAVDSFFAELKIGREDNQVADVRTFRASQVPAEYFSMIDPNAPYVNASALRHQVCAELAAA